MNLPSAPDGGLAFAEMYVPRCFRHWEPNWRLAPSSCGVDEVENEARVTMSQVLHIQVANTPNKTSRMISLWCQVHHDPTHRRYAVF